MSHKKLVKKVKTLLEEVKTSLEEVKTLLGNSALTKPLPPPPTKQEKSILETQIGDLYLSNRAFIRLSRFNTLQEFFDAGGERFLKAKGQLHKNGSILEVKGFGTKTRHEIEQLLNENGYYWNEEKSNFEYKNGTI